MRPRVDDRAVRVLRSSVTQFEQCYLDLVEIYGEDLTPAVVFGELAEFVGNLLEADDQPEVVERCMAAVEEVATTPGIDVAEVIGFAFLDGMRPDILAEARSYLGPATERVLAALGSGQLELVGDDLSGEDLSDVYELDRRGLLTAGGAGYAVSRADAPAEPPPRR